MPVDRRAIAGQWNGMLWSDRAREGFEYVTYISLELDGGTLSGRIKKTVPDYSFVRTQNGKAVMADSREMAFTGSIDKDGMLVLLVNDTGVQEIWALNHASGRPDHLLGVWRADGYQSTVDLERQSLGSLVPRTRGPLPPQPKTARPGPPVKNLMPRDDKPPGKKVRKRAPEREDQACPTFLAHLAGRLKEYPDEELKTLRINILSKNVQTMAAGIVAGTGSVRSNSILEFVAAEKEIAAMIEAKECIETAAPRAGRTLAALLDGRFDFDNPGPVPVLCAREFVKHSYLEAEHRETGRALACYANKAESTPAVAASAPPPVPPQKTTTAAPQHDQTALMMAFGRGDVSLARTLIDTGVDVWETNAAGLSAVDYARQGGHEGVLQLLKNDSDSFAFKRLTAAFVDGDFAAFRRAVDDGENWSIFVPPDLPDRKSKMGEFRRDPFSLMEHIEDAHRKYAISLRVRRALTDTATLKATVQEFYDNNNRLPDETATAGIRQSIWIDGSPERGRMELTDDGRIILAFGRENPPEIFDKTVIIEPVDSASGPLIWTCYAGTLPAVYRPRECQQ